MIFLFKMLASYVIILLFPWIQVQAQTCRSSYSKTNMKLQGHVIKTYSALQTSELCIDKCALHADCHSINYCSSQGVCEVNNANHLINPESLVYSAGCQYLNYFLRSVSRCSNKLCSYPLECTKINTKEQGYKCDSCEDKHKVLKFPSKTATDYVMYENPFNQLTAFTLSMWVQVDTSTTFHAPFSYAYTGQSKGLSVEVKNTETKIYVYDEYRSFPQVFDGQWHHICFTWTNVDGSYSMYLDGTSKGQGKNLKKGHVIEKGAVVLGQEQDSYKGGFADHQALQGSLTSVNMWDKVRTADEISALANKCSTAEGNAIKWTDFNVDKITGNLKLNCSRFCDH